MLFDFDRPTPSKSSSRRTQVAVLRREPEAGVAVLCCDPQSGSETCTFAAFSEPIGGECEYSIETVESLWTLLGESFFDNCDFLCWQTSSISLTMPNTKNRSRSCICSSNKQQQQQRLGSDFLREDSGDKNAQTLSPPSTPQVTFELIRQRGKIGHASIVQPSRRQF